jgi:hypothetical protein
MRIVIQNRTSGAFWKGESAWTCDPNEAHDFDTTAQAQKLCLNQQLANVQVVVKFENLSDIVIQVA